MQPGIGPVNVVGVYRFSSQLIHEQGDLSPMVESVTNQLFYLHFDRISEGLAFLDELEILRQLVFFEACEIVCPLAFDCGETGTQ